jgi:hypothetical protein
VKASKFADTQGSISFKFFGFEDRTKFTDDAITAVNLLPTHHGVDVLDESGVCLWTLKTEYKMLQIQSSNNFSFKVWESYDMFKTVLMLQIYSYTGTLP